MPNNQYHLFGPFRLDPMNEQVWKGETEITLRRKTFEVLRHLVERPGRLVTKAALLDAIWSDVMVSDSMPTISVGELRKALGDEAKTPQFIETVRGRGYRFIAKVTSAAADPAIKPQPLAPGPAPIIVGREAELARLQNRLEHAVEGRRQIVFVAGEAGIGKTTLVLAFLDSVAKLNKPVRIGCGQCIEQYGAGEPYMPMMEALTRLCRGPSGEQLVAILHRLAPTWLAQIPTLIDAADYARLQGQGYGATQQRMLREMGEALEAMTADRPLLLMFEDLHWSDFSTLELIAAIARRSEPARLLILGTFRPVEMLADNHPLRMMEEELERHRYCEKLRLNLLSEEDVREYLAKRFSNDAAPRFGRLASPIHKRSDGNSLFMVNVVDFLIDAGFLGSSGQASTAGEVEALPPDSIEIPSSIRQMIERNLERLKPEEQELLECASVAGAEFSAAALAAGLHREIGDVEASCARLSRHEQFVSMQGPIIWPDGTVATCFRFRHTLYQEVLYGRVTAGRRFELHRRIAEREEAGYNERAIEIAAELAHHYACASRRDKAAKYFQLAGQQAVRRGAVVEAEGHFRGALMMIRDLPEDIERDRTEFALQIELGSVLWSSKSWSHPEAGRAFARAQELGVKLGETRRLVTVLLGLGSSAVSRGQFKLGRDLGERLLRAAERRGDRASLCAAHAFLGETLIWRAHFIDAQQHLELGSSHYDEEDPGGFASWGVGVPAMAGVVVLLLGFPSRASQLIDEALRRAKRRGDFFRMGMVHMWGGALQVLLRDAGAALEHAQGLRRLAARQPAWTGIADATTGEALMIQCNWQEAVSYLRKAMAFYEAVEARGMLPWMKLAEAEFFASQGKVDDALGLVTDAIADTEELAYLKSPALRQQAILLARTNPDAPGIEAAFRAAIECARSQSARYYELQAATHFARWLQTRRRAGEARTMLAEIYDWFTEGFDTADLKGAKALLDELSA